MSNNILEETINLAIDSKLKEVHTALPAKIVSFNKAKQVADVQIVQKRLFNDGTEEFYPPLIDVPVQYLRGGGFSFTFPLSIGDSGLLIFAERSLDEWLVNGAEQVPEEVRTHSVSDAVFFPTLHNDRNEITSFSDNLEIRTESGNGKITLSKSGKIELEKDGQKVLKTLSDTLGTLGSTTVTITAGSSAGTYAIDTQSSFIALKAIIDGIRL